MLTSNQKGFTLIELLVALSIFSIASVFIADIFIKSNKAQRRTVAIGKVQSDTRFAMEAITREARANIIDYKYYQEEYGGIIPKEVSELALRDKDNNQIIFTKEEETDLCPTIKATPCLRVSIDEGENWVSISPKDIKINELKFFITPSEDPFFLNPTTGEYTGQALQPKTTIVMSAESITDKQDEKSIINIQTTASSRVYRR